MAFPFATEPAGLFGWKVRASPDWDGAPHNFFNDGLCLGLPTPPADCFRWEPFGTGLEPGETSEPRTVGFDIDPSVNEFTVYVVVAADIDERSLTGVIEGAVSSQQRGPLAGVRIAVREGPEATTDAAGDYRIAGVSPGARVVNVQAPPGCADPDPRDIVAEVEAGEVTTLNVELTCVETGTITGAISSAAFGPVSGAVVTAAPGGQTATSDLDGRYTLTGLAEGQISLTVSGLPISCYRAAPLSVVSGTNADFNVRCHRLAFATDRDFAGDDVFRIWVMNPDGSGQASTTSFGPVGEWPSWSSDGLKLAFIHTDRVSFNTSLRIIDDLVAGDLSEGTPLLISGLSNPLSDPAWAPDDAKIAFSDRGIFVVNEDGTNLTRLTTNGLAPAWSPDGTKLVFTSNRDGNHEVYVMDADGTNQVRITHNTASDRDPSWSPDGSRIAYTSSADGTLNGHEVFVMNADGTNQVRLTDNAVWDREPIWSPDGSKLVFSRRVEPEGFEIYIMNSDGTGETRLTNNSSTDVNPTW